jgi:hypothetical protein
MKDLLPLPNSQKLVVTYRVESGCLGPNGIDHVVAFCKFAHKSIQSLDAEYITWDIVARLDKNLPEMQFGVGGKALTHVQANKYLAVFNKDLDEFEGHLGNKLAELINDFMGF